MLSALALHSTSAAAQVPSGAMTPEQQRLYNQLSPAQRSAIERQLKSTDARRASDSGAQAGSEEQPVAVEPVTGTEAPDEPPRIGAGDTVVISVTLAANDNTAAPTAAERRAREDLAERLRRGNPYALDQAGLLALPGVDEIMLGGLTEAQAMLRLGAEPALRGLDLTLTLLPLDPVGADAVEPFGYAFFERTGAAARDGYSVPVPADYLIGPGDSLRVQLFGNRSAEYELQVERDGSLQFPEIGPLNVGGMSFGQVRDFIRERVSEQLIGTEVSVGMGELRLISVLLAGDVNRPGSLYVGSLSTVTSALGAGGGVARNGSLREVQVKRGGRVVAELDIYDLLLRGDTAGDVRLQAGDVVFVPPVGERVTVVGEVQRPAIYELAGDESVADVVRLAGGLTAAADRSGARLDRLVPDRGIRTLNVDLGSADGRGLRVENGDVLRVPGGITDIEAAVRLVGNVRRPGNYEWRPGLRLTDLIPDSRALEPASDLHYVLVRREPAVNAELAVMSADIAAAWQMRGSAADLELASRDTVFVFDLTEGRAQYVEPLIADLQLRSSPAAPTPVATIGGSVNAAGQYPLEAGMRVADLVRAGGGLAQNAFREEAELTRYRVDGSGRRYASIVTVDLGRALANDPGANLELEAFDYLNIRETPNWAAQNFVEILGEVRFPGRYPIRKDEHLSSVIARAGGLTDTAYPRGSVFTREALKEREREQLQTLAARIESELASESLAGESDAGSLSAGRDVLRQLRTTEAVGRLVIDLDGALRGETEDDLLMRDGDVLRIPPRPQEVTVIGEVQYTTSHVFDRGLARDDYIRKSGGLTAKADVPRIFVVRASGEVVSQRPSRFFARGGKATIEPGDTIVVPLDVDRVSSLTLWTSATQIIYNVAIAATAVSRF